MLNEQTIKLYEEIKNGAKMGICLTNDMLQKYDDEQFKYELLTAQNQYRKIGNEAEEALRGCKNNCAYSVAEERMATAMEVAVIEAATQNRDIKLSDRMYPHADKKSRALAQALIDIQIEHRRMYKRFLS